jgi:hypothetical protein
VPTLCDATSRNLWRYNPEKNAAKIRKKCMKIPKKSNDKATFLNEAGLKLCRKNPKNMKNKSIVENIFQENPAKMCAYVTRHDVRKMVEVKKAVKNCKKMPRKSS